MSLSTGRGAVLGDYELGDKIGEGSMGTVYRGTDLVHNRPVAIKFLTQLAESPNALARFQREVQTAIRMDHPNIVRGYASGVWEGCIHYFVMEYVDGITLADYMRRERIDEARAIKIVLQVARALHHISEFGLVHRDIKPENVMLTADGTAKLADLGLAKSTEGDTELTLAGAVVGTPLYMSPEQARGAASLDIRSDLYSLGATFYHLLVGQPPFNGQSAPEVIAKQISEEPVPVGEHDPGLSAGTQWVVRKMMQKNPDLRYPAAEACIAHLELLAEGKSAAGTPDTPWSGEQAPEEDAWAFAFVPPEDDLRFCRTAIANKLLSANECAQLLDRQELLARGGFALKCSFLAIERGLLTQVHVKKIEDALREKREAEDTGLVGRIAVKQGIVSEEQIQQALELQSSRSAEGRPLRLVELLQERGLVTSEQADLILSAQRKVRYGKEDEDLLALAIASGLVSAGQSERAQLIYRNNIVMGRYRAMGDVLVERRYCAETARDALARAVRRARILERPAAELLEAHRANRRRPGDTEAAAKLSATYHDQVRGFLKAGLAHRKHCRYYDAIASWERVLTILSAHADAERLIEETRTLLHDLENRRQRGAKLFDAALREWEYYRKLNPVDGALGDEVGKLEARLARLNGTARRPAGGDPRATEKVSTPTRATVRATADAEPRGGTTVETITAPILEDQPPPDPREAERDEIDKLLKRGRQAMESGRWDEARRRFEQVLAIDPESRAGRDGLAACDHVSAAGSLARWIIAAVVLLAVAGGTVAVLGWTGTEALLYGFFGPIGR